MGTSGEGGGCLHRTEQQLIRLWDSLCPHKSVHVHRRVGSHQDCVCVCVAVLSLPLEDLTGRHAAHSSSSDRGPATPPAAVSPGALAAAPATPGCAATTTGQSAMRASSECSSVRRESARPEDGGNTARSCRARIEGM